MDYFKPVSYKFDKYLGDASGRRGLVERDFKPRVSSSTLHCFTCSDEPFEATARLYRKDCANQFRIDYNFDNGQKTCIWPSDGSYSWPDNRCYDAVWVGVHGVDSICMVIWHKDLDVTRAGSFYKRYCTTEQTIRSLTETVISEIEGLPYDAKLREKSGKSIVKPFGVVSFPGSKRVHEESDDEASRAEYDEEKAIKYLMDKLKSDSAFNYDETVQTAITAFKHLCRQELKVEDFWVCVWKESGSKHMPRDQRKELLAVINGGSTNTASGSTNTASGSKGSTNIASGGGQQHVVERWKSIAHYWNT